MSCRRLCSRAWSCGEESEWGWEEGTAVVDCCEGRRRRMRPGEFEEGTAIVSAFGIAE